MCTIIAAIGVWPDKPLVIAANRDEALDRPASPPQLHAAGTFARREVLAPVDLRAGGSWLGFNDVELFVGLTNRRARADASRRSRGELVARALGAGQRGQAMAEIGALDPRDYNPFHLLVADRHGGEILWSDGEHFTELTLAPGIHWITERSFAAGASERHPRLAQLTAELPAGPAPSVTQWRALLADHGLDRRGQPKRPRRLGVSLDAMCVHARPLNYGTRSSTYLELGPEAGSSRLLHGHGRPCDAGIEWVEYRASFAGRGAQP